MGAEGPAIVVESLSRSYGEREALAGVSFRVPRGSCFGVFGANGSGKTTLLKVLATLLAPTSGRVEIAGQELPRHAARARRRLGAVLDAPPLPRDFTLREGLRYWADLHAVASPDSRIAALAERVGLTWRLRDPMSTFSRGMAQRAAFACALLPDPEILILDEPFTALDADGSALVEQVVGEYRAGGRTVVLVTHEIERGSRLADRALVLSRGRAAFQGARGEWSAEDLRARH